MQEELIEMLTVKLANKEKEVETLRCKQNAVDTEFAGQDRQLRQQQEEHARVVSELTTTNQELQRQVQHLQIQSERVRFASTLTSSIVFTNDSAIVICSYKLIVRLSAQLHLSKGDYARRSKPKHD